LAALASDRLVFELSGLAVVMATSCRGSRTGKDRRISALIRLKNGRVRANSERERNDRDGGDDGTLREHAEGVPWSIISLSIGGRRHGFRVRTDKSTVMPITNFQENRIMGANPVELVHILYDAAVRAVSDAREHLLSKDIASRSREINKAQMILAELSNSVDPVRGGQLGERLLGLYDYMQTRLIEANVRQKDAPLEEVARLLSTLQESWSQVAVPDAVLTAR